MPFIRNVKPPTPDIRPFNMPNFDGGLRNVGSPIEYKQNECCKALNVIMEDGIVETRPGLFKYWKFHLGFLPTAMYRYTTKDFDKLILCNSTSTYVRDIDGQNSQFLCFNTTIPSLVQYEDMLYFINGSEYYRYDGTKLLKVVSPKYNVYFAREGTASTFVLPEEASTESAYYEGWQVYIGSGKGLDQKRTIVAYDGETKTVTVDVDFTTIPDATSQLYITEGLYGDISVDNINNTIMYTPTYNELIDPFKGANVVDDISSYGDSTLHKNRIWFCAGQSSKNILLSTDIDNMLYVPANTFTPPTTNDGDNVVCSVSFNDVLVIFKKNTIFALYGSDESDYVLKEIAVHTGTIAPRSVYQYDSYLFYFGADGKIYALYDVRTDTRKMMSKCISDNIDLLRAPILLLESDFANAYGICYKNYYMLVVGDKILVYMPSSNAWVVWDNIKPSAMYEIDGAFVLVNADRYMYRMAFDRFSMHEDFVFNGTSNIFDLNCGYIEDFGSGTVSVKVNGADASAYKVSNSSFAVASPLEIGDAVSIDYLSILSYNDGGKSYKSLFETKDFDFGYPNKTKQLGKIYIIANTYRHYFSDFAFTAYVDYNDVNIGVSITNQISIWGVSKFGDRFINRNVVDSPPIQINRRGKIIRFRVESEGVDKPFRFFGVNGDVTIRK